MKKTNPEILAFHFAEWLSAHDIARSTGYELLASGQIATFKIGRRRYVAASEARRFIADASHVQLGRAR